MLRLVFCATRLSTRVSTPRRILLLPNKPGYRIHPSPIIFSRTFAGKRAVDEKVDDLSELYTAAKDEFEIAVEETSKNTIYAKDDRETAREEFEKFKSAYQEAISSNTLSVEETDEIKRRVGQRLRELDSALANLSEADTKE